MRKLLVLVGLLGTLGLAVVASAGAMPPTTETFHNEDSYDIDCGDFLLHEDFVVDVTETTFYDNNGNPVTLRAHVHYVGVLTTPDGETVRDPGFFTDTIDLTSGEDRQAGLIFNITVPGQGSIAQDTGLIIFEPDGDVIIKGPHEVFEQGADVICAAFA